MIRTRPVIWFIVMIACGLLVVQVIGGGYYPIAMVNGSIIWQNEFRNARKGFVTYYLQFMKTYRDSKITDTRVQLLTQDIDTVTLTTLIEERLIRSALITELADDFQTVLKNRLGKYDNDAGLQKDAQTISGLSFHEFRELVLIPQAEEDILAGRLLLRGETFGDWLQKAKSKSDVKIFSRTLRWNGEEVEE